MQQNPSRTKSAAESPTGSAQSSSGFRLYEYSAQRFWSKRIMQLCNAAPIMSSAFFSLKTETFGFILFYFKLAKWVNRSQRTLFIRPTNTNIPVASVTSRRPFPEKNLYRRNLQHNSECILSPKNGNEEVAERDQGNKTGPLWGAHRGQPSESHKGNKVKPLPWFCHSKDKRRGRAGGHVAWM